MIVRYYIVARTLYYAVLAHALQLTPSRRSGFQHNIVDENMEAFRHDLGTCGPLSSQWMKPHLNVGLNVGLR